MINYKDKVRVKSGLIPGEVYNGYMYTEEMAQLTDRELEVSEVSMVQNANGIFYSYILEDYPFGWSDELIEKSE